MTIPTEIPSTLPSPATFDMPPSRVNDFAFKIGTVNGTGSASANSLLMQSIFRMGIPVSGKNIFPSNIQGLPTWYEIRVNKDGYMSRPADIDLIVAMNPGTYKEDVRTVRSGGYLLYDSSWPIDRALQRADITVLGVPFGQMCVEAFQRDRDRTLLRNIVYTGALAALLEIDMAVVDELLKETFSKKKALLDANFKAVRMGYDYAKEHLECPLPFRLQRMDETKNHILMDGNTAFSLGAVFAGATVGAWYPITPATSLMEGYKMFCERYRVDKTTGERRFCILQAEDELSAAGIVIGAGWAGARAFTSTAGPGISLMQEFIGLAYYGEIPAVIIDVQRVGPSTGMPTRTQQGDLISLAYGSHGDTKHIVLFPADPGECFRMAPTAFDLAERFQTPVFVASDLDIGMNDWMVPRFTWDDSYRPDRGKVLTAPEIERVEKFSRYMDVDGDGIPYRTLPGTGAKGAYFTRGSGHNQYAAYTEDSAEYKQVLDRLAKKFATAVREVPGPELHEQAGAELGVVTIGGCHAAVMEAVDRLRAEGMLINYMRIRAFPFGPDVLSFIRNHKQVFIVEQNRDAQLRSLLLIEGGIAPEKMVSILDYAGLPLTAGVVVDAVAKHIRGAAV
jgi:2-oxoglutarate/2-oxoacid ferredoxin oxidoreductase subunit alpha